MGIVEIISIGLVATILSLTLGKEGETWRFYIRLATTIIILFFVVAQLSSVFDTARQLGERADIDTPYIKIVFKIIGIAYISEFGSSLCKDAGEGSIEIGRASCRERV